MNLLVPLVVAIPLSVAAIIAAFSKHMPRRVADALAILATVATGVIAAVLLWHGRMLPIVYWFGAWTPRSGMALGVSFVVDPVSATLCIFISLLVLAAFVFSLHYFDSVHNIYHALMLGFLGAMCGFSLTGDLFNLFVWFELMSAAAFALCGYKTEEPSAQQGALNFAITNTIGAFLVLVGLAMLYSRTGALNMAQIGRALDGQSDALVITSFVFIMCGFYVKAAAFPFHFWLADAHAVAPTPVCILFSGIMVELGVYAVARVYWAVIDGPFAAHRPAVLAVLLTVGTITAVLGAVMCFGQRHLKRLLAFSTVSHVGLLIIGFALLTPDALAGSAIYTLGHGLVKAALFIGSGILLHRLGTVDELELYGHAKPHKGLAALFVAGGLGLAGFPPFATFLGDHTITEAASHQHQSWVAIVFFIAGALTAGAVFRVTGRVFFGWGRKPDEAIAGAKKIEEHRETRGPHRSMPAVMFVPAFVLVVLAIALGLLPGLHEAARKAAYTMADRSGYQARVLDSMYLPVLSLTTEHTPPPSSLARGIGATAAGLLLAALALMPASRKRRTFTASIVRGSNVLRAIHSGHVGDYVAFLTFGVAALAIALGVLIKLVGM